MATQRKDFSEIEIDAVWEKAAFIKIVYKSIEWKTISKYCSVVFGLSLVSAIVWDAIKAFPCFINLKSATIIQYTIKGRFMSR